MPVKNRRKLIYVVPRLNTDAVKGEIRMSCNVVKKDFKKPNISH